VFCSVLLFFSLSNKEQYVVLPSSSVEFALVGLSGLLSLLVTPTAASRIKRAWETQFVSDKRS
jgi:hypothetical protein